MRLGGAGTKLNGLIVSVSFERLDMSGPLREAVRTLVICHTRELAYQIKHEFERFAKYFPVRGGEGKSRGSSGRWKLGLAMV